MSKETKAALDDAIAAHVADEMDNCKYLIGYVLTTATVSADNPNLCGYLVTEAEDQQHHVARGLSAYGVGYFDEQAWGSNDDA